MEKAPDNMNMEVIQASEEKADRGALEQNIFSKVKEYKDSLRGRIITLLDEKVERALVLRKDDLDRLTPKDREALIRFYARFAASIESLSFTLSREYERWAESFSGEYAETISLSDNADFREITDRLVKLAGFFWAQQIDTNSSGGPGRFMPKCVEELGKFLARNGRQNEAEALYNPFNLKKGTEFFEMPKNRLERKTIEDIDFQIDGSIKKGAVIVNDEVRDLLTLNGDLAGGQAMLRDGSNYFGGLGAFEKKLTKLAPGRRAIFRTGSVFSGEYKVEVEIVGTNQAELEAEYGKAYLPFFLSYVRVRLRSPESGVEEEYRLQDCMSILE